MATQLEGRAPAALVAISADPPVSPARVITAAGIGAAALTCSPRPCSQAGH